MLFVIDGSKALAKAIRAKFGARALVQRCQVHKRRNVEEHLPEDRMYHGPKVVVEHRFAQPIYNGILDAGFKVTP